MSLPYYMEIRPPAKGQRQDVTHPAKISPTDSAHLASSTRSAHRPAPAAADQRPGPRPGLLQRCKAVKRCRPLRSNFRCKNRPPISTQMGPRRAVSHSRKSIVESRKSKVVCDQESESVSAPESKSEPESLPESESLLSSIMYLSRIELGS